MPVELPDGAGSGDGDGEGLSLAEDDEDGDGSGGGGAAVTVSELLPDGLLDEVCVSVGVGGSVVLDELFDGAADGDGEELLLGDGDGVLLFVALGEDDEVFDGVGDEVGPVLDELDRGGPDPPPGGGGPTCSSDVVVSLDDDVCVTTGSGARTATATEAARLSPAGLNFAT